MNKKLLSAASFLQGVGGSGPQTTYLACQANVAAGFSLVTLSSSSQGHPKLFPGQMTSVISVAEKLQLQSHKVYHNASVGSVKQLNKVGYRGDHKVV